MWGKKWGVWRGGDTQLGCPRPRRSVDLWQDIGWGSVKPGITHTHLPKYLQGLCLGVPGGLHVFAKRVQSCTQFAFAEMCFQEKNRTLAERCATVLAQYHPATSDCREGERCPGKATCPSQRDIMCGAEVSVSHCQLKGVGGDGTAKQLLFWWTSGEHGGCRQASK